MKIVKCKLCEKVFEAKSQGKRTVLYCSTVCRNRNIAAGRRLHKYPKYLLDCVQCGKPVYAKNMSFDKPNRKFCDKACKQRHERTGVSMSEASKKKLSIAKTKHGFSQDKLHRVWAEMIRRCNNKKASGYQNYGGRGITVSEEWLDFLKFREWAINNGYKKELTIERLNVNGNYCKENCTWIPMSEQSKNRRPSSEWKLKKHLAKN